MVCVAFFPSSDLGLCSCGSDFACLMCPMVRCDASNVVCGVFIPVVIPTPAVVIVVVVPTLLHVVHLVPMPFFSFVVQGSLEGTSVVLQLIES